MNLAASFVNGFVNCGFGVDKLLADNDAATKFFNKNREYGWDMRKMRKTIKTFLGILSAAASQGLIHKWDIDQGLAQCDRFLYVNDDYVRVCFRQLFVSQV